MSAEFMVICKEILFRNCVIASLFVFAYNTWAQCNNDIKIMRRYESEGKYTVRNLIKSKAIALELAETYVRNHYGQDATEEKKPYEITKLAIGWVVEGIIRSDRVVGRVFVIEIGRDDGKTLSFGHRK